MSNVKIHPDGVSIVICTYNGRKTLKHALSHLASQQLSCPTELILVDNASTDGSKEFCDKWWSENGPEHIKYRSMLQEKPGKTYAQEMGFEAAIYEYLLVVDDDNLLAPNYVSLAHNITSSNPKIGALGGWGEAEHEEPKPDWFDKNQKYFAVGKQGNHSGDITSQKGCLYGAGMLLRKSHWRQLYKLGYVPILSCRQGDSLSSGGDTEYCFALRLLGYQIWYDDRLYFKHYMISGRVRLSYIKRLRKSLSESNFRLRVYTDEMVGRSRSRQDFIKEFLMLLFREGLPMSYRYLLGNFNQKELAKEYFRKLRMLCTKYDVYLEDKKDLKSWLSRASQQ